MDGAIHWQVLGGAAALAVAMGFLAARTGFCTLGGVSDWLNMGATGRMRAWLLAMAVAILGVAALEYSAGLTLSETFPPYRTAPFIWARYLLGGFMFGIGMTLASGCVNKNLVRVGGGNLKSLVVLIIAAGCAYAMMWTDFYASAFAPWMGATTVQMPGGQSLDAVVASLFGINTTANLRLGIALVLGGGLLAYSLSSAGFRRNWHYWGGGLGVGAIVVAAWWLTGPGFGANWQEWAMMADDPPLRVATQSLTFVSALGDGVHYLGQPSKIGLLTFSAVTALGVIVGSFLQALFSGTLRLEWFVNFATFRDYVGGAVLMGTGGSLAMGCTVGQGVSGVSTLALGSFLTVAAIIAGSVTTMRLQYRFA